MFLCVKKAGWVVTAILLGTACAWGQSITPDGTKLAQALDGSDVEHLWLSKQYVHWLTGTPRDKPVTDGKVHTHCSAFAAAFSAKLGVYILRPPVHSASDLANAQYDWLLRDGEKRGWKPVETMEEAQADANAGELVVAVYKETELEKHGHIAVVHPDDKSSEAIATEGPQITQAGIENFASAPLKEGFRHHKGAWKKHRILFFVHRVDWSRVSPDVTPDNTATDDDNT